MSIIGAIPNSLAPRQKITAATLATNFQYLADQVNSNAAPAFSPGSAAEVGRYLDFHGAPNGYDFDVRLDAQPGAGQGAGEFIITAANVTASGSITAANVTASGSITAANVTASGSITAAKFSSRSSMAMVAGGQSGATGSFVCKSSGAGDTNLAGITFWNDAYAIQLGIRADGYFGLGGWSRNAWSWYSDPSGNVVSAGDMSAYSDPRLKENFQRISNPLELLATLDGGTFTWKSGIQHTECKAGKKDYGVLADQVEAVMPEIVNESIEIDGEKYKTVAYEKLVPVLIEAIKELNDRIKVLEGK